MKAVLRFSIIGDAISVAETLLLNGYQVAIRQTIAEIGIGTWEVEVSKDESNSDS